MGFGAHAATCSKFFRGLARVLRWYWTRLQRGLRPFHPVNGSLPARGDRLSAQALGRARQTCWTGLRPIIRW
jgi:hypothetical protein